MTISHNWLHRLRYIVADFIAVLLSYLLFNVIRYATEDTTQSFGELCNYLFNPKAYLVGAVYLAFWIGIFALSGYYNKPISKSRLTEFSVTATSVLIGSVIVFLGLVVDDLVRDTDLYLKLFGLLTSLVMILVYIPRLLITNYGIATARKRGRPDSVLLIGNGKAKDDIRRWMASIHTEIAAEIETLIPAPGSSVDGALASLLPRIDEAIRERNPGVIVVAIEGTYAEYISLLLYKLYPYKLPIRVPMRSLLFAGAKVRVETMLGEPMVDLTATNMGEFGKNIKWLFDKLFSVSLLILLSPLLAYIAYRVKRSSSGPVFYKQERIGLHGKPFWIYKFRSMYTNAEETGPMLSQTGDKRVTDIGRTLRKYRLDELPQLWNVLRGDMSIVGPRPERRHYIRRLVQQAPYYYLLHNVRPGITSWGMVRYGYASDLKEMLERLEYDWLYYENMSIRLDVAILFYTAKTILKGTGK